jgi:hypothetical protein
VTKKGISSPKKNIPKAFEFPSKESHGAKSRSKVTEQSHGAKSRSEKRRRSLDIRTMDDSSSLSLLGRIPNFEQLFQDDLEKRRLQKEQQRNDPIWKERNNKQKRISKKNEASSKHDNAGPKHAGDAPFGNGFFDSSGASLGSYRALYSQNAGAISPCQSFGSSRTEGHRVPDGRARRNCGRQYRHCRSVRRAEGPC